MNKTYNMNGSNNDASNIQHTTDTEAIKNIYVPDYMDTIFQRLDAQDVEQFHKSYHLWCAQQRIKILQTEIGALQQAIADNSALMQQVQPSVIALASLAQLQASGVHDLSLLDRMLARGDSWLDHTMQLLEQCEEMDVIRGDYTQWCEHALEGAYEWIFSIESREAAQPTQPAATVQQELQTPTEEQLLLKLMSDEEVTEKIPAPDHQFDAFEQATIQTTAPNKKITQPLEHPEPITPEASLPIRKITQPLKHPEHEGIGTSLPARKNTRPLELEDALTEMALPETPTGYKIPQLVSVSLDEERAEAQQVPIQIEEIQGAISPATEQIGTSSIQEDMPDATETAFAFKDADISTEVEVTAKRAVSVATLAQTRGTVKGLISSPQERKMPQTQKVRQKRGFWHWLRRLYAALLHR